MSIVHYRAFAGFAASVSLTLAACVASPPPVEQAQGQPNATKTQEAASNPPEDIDPEATIWTVLGLAKKESVKDPGPQTGRTVSPILWQAANRQRLHRRDQARRILPSPAAAGRFGFKGGVATSGACPRRAMIDRLIAIAGRQSRLSLRERAA